MFVLVHNHLAALCIVFCLFWYMTCMYLFNIDIALSKYPIQYLQNIMIKYIRNITKHHIEYENCYSQSLIVLCATPQSKTWGRGEACLYSQCRHMMTSFLLWVYCSACSYDLYWQTEWDVYFLGFFPCYGHLLVVHDSISGEGSWGQKALLLQQVLWDLVWVPVWRTGETNFWGRACSCNTVHKRCFVWFRETSGKVFSTTCGSYVDRRYNKTPSGPLCHIRSCCDYNYSHSMV